MRSGKLIFNTVVLFVLLSISGSWRASECTAIDVEAKVSDTSPGRTYGSVEMIFKTNSDQFLVYQLHSKGRLELLQDNKADSLLRGKYEFVITGRNEDTPYCPKYLNIIIN